MHEGIASITAQKDFILFGKTSPLQQTVPLNNVFDFFMIIA
jgi:hypothetical protein